MKQGEPLCRCNYCDKLYVDTNPQSDAPRFDNTDDLDSLETCQDVDEGIEEFFQGCPECKSDGHLSDITGVEDLTAEEQKKYTLVKLS